MILKRFTEKFIKNSIYWIVILLAFIPGLYTSSTIYPFVTIKTLLFRGIVGLLSVLYLMLILKNKNYLPKKSKLLGAFFLFLITCFLSGIISLDPVQSFWSSPERMIGTYSIIFFFLFTLITASVFKTKKIWNNILTWWNWIIVSSSVVSFVVFLINNIIKGTSIFSIRFQGFSGNPIYFATIILVFLFINIYLFFEKVSENKKIKHLIPYLFISVLYVFFILITGTRGALVALGATGIIMLISLIFNKNIELEQIFKIDFQKAALTMVIFLAIVTGTIFALKETNFVRKNYILLRLTNINISDNASFSRIVVGKIGLNCFIQKPLTGWGFDNFEICFQQNFDKTISEMLPIEKRFDKTHNMPFEIMATNGIIGIIAFLGVYFFAYKNIRDLMINNEIYFYSGLSIILAIIVYFIQNLFVFDVFEGLIATGLIFGFVISIGKEKQINWNIKINDKIKDLIFIVIALIVVFYVFDINYREFKNTQIPKRIENLLKENKNSEAVEIVKSIAKIKHANRGDLYMGAFNLIIQSKKDIGLDNRKEYHEAVATDLIKIIEKRHYLTKFYVLSLINISSKTIFKDLSIEEIDVKRAEHIYNLSKKYNLNQPEIEKYYSQILLNSKKEADILKGVSVIKNALDFYPEKGIFNLMYGHYLLERTEEKAKAIEHIKLGLSKSGSIDTIGQLMRSVKDLLIYNEPDFVIELINHYVAQNPTKMELYTLLSETYVLKNNYVKAIENYNIAKASYDKVKIYHYSPAIEKDLEILLQKINKIKP